MVLVFFHKIYIFINYKKLLYKNYWILDNNKIKIDGFQENEKIKYILSKYDLSADDLEKINKLIIQSSKNTKFEKDLSQLAGREIDKKYFEKYLKNYL